MTTENEMKYYALTISVVKLSKLIDEWDNCLTNDCAKAFDVLKVSNWRELEKSDSAQKRLEQLTGPCGKILYKFHKILRARKGL